MDCGTRRFRLVGMGGDADALDDFPCTAEWMLAADGSWSVSIAEIGGERRVEIVDRDPRCAEMIRLLLDRLGAARPIVPALAATCLVGMAAALIALVDYWPLV